jgi:GNAT superfamily N-acetyltransferase
VIRVRPTDGRRDLARFVDLPLRLHRGREGYVAPLRIQELETLDPKRNPFFEHARVSTFLAERDGRVVGRIALIDDDLHNEIHGDDLAFFGFFDAVDGEVAAALLDEVETRARALGRSLLRGPADPSMNDRAGLQIDAFERPPAVMMPWSPPEYAGWIEAAGFAKAKDLQAWLAEEDEGIPERFQRLADRARKRTGAQVREVRLDDWDAELATVQRIYTEAWEKNWGQVPYTDAEFAHLAETLRMIVDPRVALFLELDGEVVGVALGLPDLNQVLAKFHGRIVPFGILPLLRRKAIIDQIRLAILGVLPAYRNRGLELILIEEVWRRGTSVGYRRAELSWILEDNEPLIKGLRALGARPIKTYRLYQKAL